MFQFSPSGVLPVGSCVPLTYFQLVCVLKHFLNFWHCEILQVHLLYSLQQGCPNFWCLWDTLEEEELSRATHYIHKHLQKKKKLSNKVLSKFRILCWAAFIAILDCMRSAGCRLDSPIGVSHFPKDPQSLQ